MQINHLFLQLFNSSVSPLLARPVFQEARAQEIPDATDSEMRAEGTQFDPNDPLFAEHALDSQARQAQRQSAREAQTATANFQALQEAVRHDQVVYGPNAPETRESERKLEMAKAESIEKAYADAGIKPLDEVVPTNKDFMANLLEKMKAAMAGRKKGGDSRVASAK